MSPLSRARYAGVMRLRMTHGLTRLKPTAAEAVGYRAAHRLMWGVGFSLASRASSVKGYYDNISQYVVR